MSHRTPSHWLASVRSVPATAPRRSGENASSCTTSGHAGKYGSRPVRDDELADLRRTTPGRARGRPHRRGRSTRDVPRATDGPGRRGSGRSRGSALTRAGRAPRARRRARPGRRGGRPRRSRGCSRASRRRRPARRRAGHARSSRAGPGRARDRDARRAALPHAHEPDRVEPQRRDAAPFGLRHVREIDPAACVPAQLVEPHPRVDLVDEGVRDHRRRPIGLVRAVLPPSPTSSAPSTKPESMVGVPSTEHAYTPSRPADWRSGGASDWPRCASGTKRWQVPASSDTRMRLPHREIAL